MEIPRTSGFSMEVVFGLLAATLSALALLALFDVDTKYKLAVAAAVGGGAFLAAFPERRVACLVLWVMIHPLSIEKIFFIDAAEGPRFTEPTIVFNASDGPLVLLTLFLAVESLLLRRI